MTIFQFQLKGSKHKFLVPNPLFYLDELHLSLSLSLFILKILQNDTPLKL